MAGIETLLLDPPNLPADIPAILRYVSVCVCVCSHYTCSLYHTEVLLTSTTTATINALLPRRDIHRENYFIGDGLTWQQETIELSYSCVDGLIPPSLGYLENLRGKTNKSNQNQTETKRN